MAILNEPDARMPLREAYRAIARQLEVLQEVAGRPSFSLNLPTHYLAWPIALDRGRSYGPPEAGAALENYPLQDLAGALRGAQSLGLVRRQGEQIELTDTGAAVKALLPRDLAQWAEIHRRAASRDRTATLAALCPSAGAVLRILLLQQPAVRLLLEGLRAIGGSGSLVDLAAACDRLDHARAPVLFLLSEALAELQDERGAVAWARAAQPAFRPTISYQLKSVLRHASLLAADVRLGSGRRFDPAADRWALA